jgi:hypothetical protein
MRDKEKAHGNQWFRFPEGTEGKLSVAGIAEPSLHLNSE